MSSMATGEQTPIPITDGAVANLEAIKADLETKTCTLQAKHSDLLRRLSDLHSVLGHVENILQRSISDLDINLKFMRWKIITSEGRSQECAGEMDEFHERVIAKMQETLQTIRARRKDSATGVNKKDFAWFTSCVIIAAVVVALFIFIF